MWGGLPHPPPHLSDPDQNTHGEALAERADALEVIAFVDPVVLASVLGRSQPTAPLLVAARVGVEVADLRHAHWIALRDASKAMSAAYAEAGAGTAALPRRVDAAPLPTARRHRRMDPRPGRRMTTPATTTTATTTGEQLVVGKSTRTTARPSGRGPGSDAAAPPLTRTPPHNPARRPGRRRP
ncbi:hypothetical protein [Pseudonocardia sp. Ae707_Ps2]|uniref:hypothetical protein n=1 Tax=Pseudonocardia sp. Ae707_Ps2 TaxID=2212992 RepID=UPI00307CE57E